MLPVHYTETKWNHNENLPLTVSHHCIIPLPPIRRRLLSQIIKCEHRCFPLPISCFLFLTWIFNWAISNHLFCCASSLLCCMQLEGIVSETGIKYTWSRQDESRMYYLEECRYYSCFLHGSIKTGGPRWKRNQQEMHIEIQMLLRANQFADTFPFLYFQQRIVVRAIEVDRSCRRKSIDHLA